MLSTAMAPAVSRDAYIFRPEDGAPLTP